MTAKTDHGAITFCSEVDEDGKFEIVADRLTDGVWNVKLGWPSCEWRRKRI